MQLFPAIAQRYSEEHQSAGEAQRLAQEIAFARITDARKSGKIGLNTTQEITDRTEGKAPQFVNTSITTSSIESLNLTNEELAQIAFNDVEEAEE